MNCKAVSVIIPTHNREQLLPRAIDSVLLQLQKNDELIVIDDGSSDSTANILKEYGASLRYFQTDHIGAGGARNAGIEMARNPLIGFLDSDDEWLPHKLEIQRNLLMQRPDIMFCYSNMMVKRRNGVINHFSLNNWPGVAKSLFFTIGDKFSISDRINLPENVKPFDYYVGSIYQLLLSGFYATLITLLVDKDRAGDALHFPEDLSVYEDWEFFGRLSRKGKCAYMHCETAINHTHLSPRLTDSNTYERSVARIKVLNRVWGKDKHFLHNHQDLYNTLMDEEYITQMNCLIENSRIFEARELIPKVKNLPLYQKLLHRLPHCVAASIGKSLFKNRRRIIRFKKKLPFSF